MPNDATVTGPPVRTCPICHNPRPREEYRLRGTSEGQRGRIVCAQCYSMHCWATDKEDYALRNECVLNPNNGKWYTREYYQEHFINCASCGCSIDRGEEVRLPDRFHDTHTYCQSCYADRYTECAECDEVYFTNAMRTVYMDNGSTILVCMGCTGDFSRCATCSNLYESLEESGNCAECDREAEREQYRVRAYAYRPVPLFFYATKEGNPSWIDSRVYAKSLLVYNDSGVQMYDDLGRELKKPNDTYRFGFELEVEGHDDETVTEVVSRLQHRKLKGDNGENQCDLYVKEDGSLGDNGFEIVSHPMTFEYWQLVAGEFETEFKHMRAENCRSADTTTCGMHLHMSRNAFSQLGIYKLQKPVYENPSFILKLSGRKRTYLERWASVANSQNVNTEYARKAKGEQLDFERYVAVNLRNANTIELRFFKGTLNFGTFERNLQFGVGAHRYVMQAGIRDISVDNFKSFILSRDCKDLERMRYYFEPSSRVVSSKAKMELVKTAPKEEAEERYEETVETVTPLRAVIRRPISRGNPIEFTNAMINRMTPTQTNFIIDLVRREGACYGWNYARNPDGVFIVPGTPETATIWSAVSLGAVEQVIAHQVGQLFQVYFAGTDQHEQHTLNREEHIFNVQSGRYEFRDPTRRPAPIVPPAQDGDINASCPCPQCREARGEVVSNAVEYFVPANFNWTNTGGTEFMPPPIGSEDNDDASF